MSTLITSLKAGCLKVRTLCSVLKQKFRLDEIQLHNVESFATTETRMHNFQAYSPILNNHAKLILHDMLELAEECQFWSGNI